MAGIWHVFNVGTEVMATILRFGRKVRLPSTFEIKRELMMMVKADAIAAVLKAQECSADDFANVLEELNLKYHVSRDRVNMLLCRFGPGQSGAMEAAKSLNARKHQYDFRNNGPKDFS